MGLTNQVLSLGGVDGGRSPEATKPGDRGKFTKKLGQAENAVHGFLIKC